MRKASIQQVAEDAGVSRATVDRVLNRRGGVSMDKERAVLVSARALGLDRNFDAPPAKTLRVCVLMKPPVNPFYEHLGRGFREANLLFAGQAITAYVSHIDVLAPELIRQQLRRIIFAYDALILVAPASEQILDLLTAIAARIPLVTLATDLPLDAPHYYVGPSNYEAGRLAGGLMGRLLGASGGKILLVAGLQSFSGHREREAGFLSILGEEYPRCRLAARIESHDREGAQVAESVAGAFKRDPEISGIYNISQGNDGIARRLATVRRDRRTIFICHDLTATTRELLLARQVDVVIDQDPILEARRAMEIILQHYGRSKGVKADGITPVRVVFRENAANRSFE